MPGMHTSAVHPELRFVGPGHIPLHIKVPQQLMLTCLSTSRPCRRSKHLRRQLLEATVAGDHNNGPSANLGSILF